MSHQIARILQSYPIPVSVNLAALVNFGSWVGENMNRVANNTNVGMFYCDGRTTGHVRLLTQPLEGDVITITVGTIATRFEFDTDSIVAGGNIAVTIGATVAATAANLVAKIGSSIGLILSAFQNATDTNVVDMIAKLENASIISLLESTGGVRFALQLNKEAQQGQVLYLYTVRRVVSAEDVSRGRIQFNTSFSALINYVYNMTVSATLATAITTYAGTITENGGVLEFTTSVLVAGNVIRLWVVGTLGDKENTDSSYPAAITKSSTYIP